MMPYIRDRLIASGGFYPSTAEINGLRYLRIVLKNPATTLADIERLVESLRDVKQKNRKAR
jgi:hypothetical protein